MSFRRPLMVVASGLYRRRLWQPNPTRRSEGWCPKCTRSRARLHADLAQQLSGKVEVRQLRALRVGINFTEQVTTAAPRPAALRAQTGHGRQLQRQDGLVLSRLPVRGLARVSRRTHESALRAYNDINDIDSARVPILLPQSIYSFQNRDFLSRRPASSSTDGSICAPPASSTTDSTRERSSSTPSPPPEALQVTELGAPYLVGGRLLWETPVEGLRLGASAQVLASTRKLLAGGTS